MVEANEDWDYGEEEQWEENEWSVDEPELLKKASSTREVGVYQSDLSKRPYTLLNKDTVLKRQH